MKKTFTRTIAVLLAVLLVCAAMPLTVFAADTTGTCGSGVNWEFDASSGKLTISSANNSAMEDYTSSTEPGWVTQGWSDSITTIEVKGVKKIGNYAFWGLSNLTSVTMDSSLQNIGTYVFSFCTSLTELTFPVNLEGIGQHAFKESGITKLTIWRQSGAGGALVINSVDSGYAGIGSLSSGDTNNHSGEITINGGNITVNGGENSAGIVTAQGGYHGAGIGGGTRGLATVTINGGTVNATGGEKGAGIGSGYNNPYVSGKSINITINGGTVTAAAGVGTGKAASAIGCGGANSDYKTCSISINGGIVDASAGGIKSQNSDGSKQGTIDLSWTDADHDSLKAGSYTGEVKLSKSFKDEEGFVYEATDSLDDPSILAGKTLTPYDSLDVHLAGQSISLDGDIAVNFYMELSDDVVGSDQDPYMLFSIPDTSPEYQTQKVYLNAKAGEKRTLAKKVETTEKTYYLFKCRVAAKDMESDITAQMIDGEQKGGVYRYSVKRYADYLMENAYTDDTHETVKNQTYADAYDLVDAMLTYGKNARYFFGKTEDQPGEITTAVPADYDVCTEHETIPDGVTFEGASLSLKSETTLSLYFTSDTPITLSIEGKTEGVDYVLDHANKVYVIRIRGIAAADLDKSVTVRVDDADAVTYSPLTYCYQSQSSDDAKLVNTVRALYLYWVEAKAYFEKTNPQPGGGE